MKLEFSTVFGRDGITKYLTRLIVGSLRVHFFWRGDEDREPHDHQWEFWTFPLRTYLEEVYNPHTNTKSMNVVKAWRIHHRRADYAHRILYAVQRLTAGPFYDKDYTVVNHQAWFKTGDRLLTIVWFGSKARPWGFFVGAGTPDVHWVPQEIYLADYAVAA